MCGIAGFINFSSHDEAEAAARVRNMAAAIAHRGPDEEGFYVDAHAALGHKRLSIIDLSSGQQPMADPDGNFQIVFNGEVYNFQEIKAELEKLGCVFRTTSDTEVILYAYREWGAACVDKFNGMFSFVIWDKAKQTLFAARDRVGKKPFYYAWNGQDFAFASEIKALLAGGVSAKQINPRALDCYFTLGYIPVPFTIYQDISKLPPAHALTLTAEGMSLKRYWHLDYGEPRFLSMDQAAEELDALLLDAVKLRMISEVPLGAFLSGGIDSSLVVAYMSRILDKPVLTNTIGFNDGGFNEMPAARTIADLLKTDHREFTVEPDASHTIEKIASYLDEPFADSSALPTWHVCRMARQNVTVVLSGDGGDEGFGGYTFRYIPHQTESRLRSLVPTALRSTVFAALGAIYPASGRLPKYLRLKTILENLSRSDAEAFYHDLIWLRSDTRRALYAHDFMESLKGFTPAEMVIPLYVNSSAMDPVSRSQHTDVQFYMTDDVLAKVDRMSMAHSLEVRNPLLDYRVLEFAARLPAPLKIQKQQGKSLLRHMVRKQLGDAIYNLPKKGFSIPAAQWLRSDLKPMAHDAVFRPNSLIADALNRKALKKIWNQHQSGSRDHSVFLWGLMMLDLWDKNFNK